MKKKSRTKIEKFENVELDLDEQTLLSLCLAAHEKDITLNELCNQIILEQIKKEKKKLYRAKI